MLVFEHDFEVSALVVWRVIGTPDRVDWVPGGESCDLDGNVRTLDLPGAGTIQERIVTLDSEAYRLVYQCISSPMPLEHHEASMQLMVIAPNRCQLRWQAEIRPTAFEPFLQDSMQGALQQLLEVVAKEAASVTD